MYELNPPSSRPPYPLGPPFIVQFRYNSVTFQLHFPLGPTIRNIHLPKSVITIIIIPSLYDSVNAALASLLASAAFLHSCIMPTLRG